MRVFLETERLVLRRFTMADLDGLVGLDADPEVMHFVTGGLPYLARHDRRRGPAHIPWLLRGVRGVWLLGGCREVKRGVPGVVSPPAARGLCSGRGRVRLPAAQVGLGQGVRHRRIPGGDPQAQMAAAGNDVQGMFSNDIVGASQARDGTKPDPHTLRLFVEGVPTAATPGQHSLMRSIGGENDGVSRQLGRFVKEVAPFELTDMNIRPVWRRDRYLRASDHVSFQGRATRPPGSPSRGRTSPTSTRTRRWSTACSSVTSSSSWTSTTLPGSPR